MATTVGSVIAAPYIVRAQTNEKIRIAAVPTDDMTPVFYAIKNGLYQKAGLDVEVMPSANGGASTAAVVAGVYELGKSSPMAALLAHLHGLPLTIVSNGSLWVSKSPYNLVLTAIDSPIKSPAECSGKVAAVAGLNDIAQYGLMLWIDKNGGDSRTMKWIEIPNSAAAAALIEHRVDLAGIIEPQLSAALAGGKVHPVGDAFSAIANTWVASLYLARPDWAASHSDALKRWVRVTHDAATYTNSHHAQTVPLMSEVTKIPVDVLQRMTRIVATTGSDPALLQPILELGLRYKAFPQAFPVKDLYFFS